VPVGVTRHQTQRPRGQVGASRAHPAHRPSQPPPLDPGGEMSYSWPGAAAHPVHPAASASSTTFCQSFGALCVVRAFKLEGAQTTQGPGLRSPEGGPRRAARGEPPKYSTQHEPPKRVACGKSRYSPCFVFYIE
jgi:hypothetical protein